MKIALDWVNEYLDRPVTAGEAGEALLNAGLPIESIKEETETKILDVEVTSNRTDCLSHIGVGRELAALLGRSLKVTRPVVSEGGDDVGVKVEIEDAGAGGGCSYYSARVIRGVKVGASPAWLKRRVESIGLRSINNVVDVTNLVLMEIGQPLHAFDLGKIEGAKIVVRRAREGEKIVAIDGKTYELGPANLVIADSVRAVAVAGVMGGKEAEVNEGTRDVLLESARFDPMLIRATARQLTLMSDSSYRFERGIDPTAAEWASRRAAALIVEVAGGTMARGAVVAGAATAREVKMILRLRRIAEILGIEIPAETVVRILAALGFSPVRSGDVVACTAPSHRLDVEREIDLIEEVARVHGYKHLPVHDRVSHPVQPERAGERAARAVRGALMESGFSEAITLSFVPRAEGEAMLPKSVGDVIGVKHGGWKSEVLRPSVLPSLLAVRRTNQYAGTADARVFEVAETFWQSGDAKENPPARRRVLALVGNSVTEVRGALEAVAARLSAGAKIGVTPAEIAMFAAGGEVLLDVGGKRVVIGQIGLFAEGVQKQYDLRQAVAGAEVGWEVLLAAFEPVRRAAPLPKYPGVDRDLSVVVEEGVRWADVEGALAGAGLEKLERIEFVGTFRNKQVGTGKKSLTLSLAFRDANATLRSEQVDGQVQAAVKVLGEKFGAALRT